MYNDCECETIMLVKLHDIFEWFDLPEITYNALKKKYPTIYNDNDYYEIEYEFSQVGLPLSDKTCYNAIKIIWDTDHITFTNKKDYNTSSEFALWLSNTLSVCDCIPN
jgi:hypothetical protein